uniref:DUF3782 domain-containing protein n=1 Tax=Ignisphaera aggregans TaxID=334771 RepID=A0A7J2U089_9CREN
MSIDWGRLEEVVERAVRRARAEELKDIAEAIKTFAEYVKKGFDIIAEHSKRMEEHDKKIEELSRRLEELTKAVQEQGKILAEHSKILAEHSKRLEEFSKRIEELTRKVGEQSAVLGSIGRRWGRDLEKMVIELYRHVLEERGIIPEKIERFTYVDTDGRYYVKGSRIEFDTYIHNDKVYLVEVKSHADIEDVEWFYKRAEIYEKIRGRKPDKLVLVAVHIDEDAYERAKELGIEVIYGAIIP